MSKKSHWEKKTIFELGHQSKLTVQTGPFGSQLHSDDYLEEGIPFLLIRNIGPNGLLTNDLPRISEQDAQRLARYSLQVGDIVFSRVGRVGSCFLVTDEQAGWIISGQTLRIRVPYDNLEPRYFLYALLDQKSQEFISGASVGTTRTSINTSILESLPIQLPPLLEQRKIANILTTIDNLIEKTEALIAKYQTIKQGMMHDLFTRGVDAAGKLRPTFEDAPELYKESAIGWIPKEWEESVVANQLVCIEQGKSPECDSEPAAPGEWGILKTTAVVWDGYNSLENKRLPSKLKPNFQYEVKVGDVFITRGGPNSRVGVVAYVYSTQEKLMMSDKLYRLVPKSSIDAEFLSLALSSESTQTYLSTLKTGLAESQTNISQTIVRKLIIPVPEKLEQRKIIDRVASVRGLIDKEKNNLRKLRSQKSGLMQDLLTGKVRVTVDTAAASP
ncbi:restriction endonuclease subunit S [Alkalinema sp. FACHB-956]|uniref:restriction endonuclease subunit S n=1 Tax=Alkalinema sp. FACHB-956 TaxID=2692768 RepID=UPI0016828889|nr:restriction endonuclease subunit S [Alkalinema sp. FACHB-956]MBD2329273.1 restriction endonuclease subunit S [Alkalinema sp. FACHB-956]